MPAAMAQFGTPAIRDVAAGDERRWRELWAGYNAFYETVVAEDVTAETWRRLLDPRAGVGGRVALTGDEISGFAVHVLHPSTWTIGSCCYLEDLFVDPSFRGSGIGRALIQDLMDLGQKRGWARVYWHTRAGNARARALYDQFAQADDFVRYRLRLGVR